MNKTVQKLQEIVIQNARMHNLKSVSISIPRNKLVVVTGVSGSGKSSLVFDTLYAEGHRRYVESLSSYARQFLSRMQKPDVDSISGLSPAIAIQQKVSSTNPRSTVGTLTEIYDFLKLLFARIGKTYSPVSGREVISHSISDVVDFIASRPVGTKLFLFVRHSFAAKELRKELELTLQKGFTRILRAGKIEEIEDLLAETNPAVASPLQILIDRFIVPTKMEEDWLHRVADSVQTAFNEGHGKCFLEINGHEIEEFSEYYEADGIVFEKPTVQFFSFNNPLGICQTCNGTGRTFGYLLDKVILPDLTIQQGAIALLNDRFFSAYKKELLQIDSLPQTVPYHQLTEAEKEIIWEGKGKYPGLKKAMKTLDQAGAVHANHLISQFKGEIDCPDCGGARIRKEAKLVKINGYSIHDCLLMSIDELAETFQNLVLSEYETQVVSRLRQEIETRLSFLQQVGLGYLNLSRRADSLSGGETQRINLATSLGSSLVGSMYILDEPSVGLHPRDGERLADVLEALRDQGNTVVVVEHDEALMKRADYLVDMGPAAGEYGGKVVFAGTFNQLPYVEDSITAKYLTNQLRIEIPKPRQLHQFLRLEKAAFHNLKHITVEIPYQA
ncbi:MAG: excinuclease ABC subunit A, partial [Bacteroidia bacterium]|nr:excinuclease ABC subunit A [Bacteroidia bacterium]